VTEVLSLAGRLTPLSDVKVVILGQDPYYGEGQATGLAFAVREGEAELPRSLQNIYRELECNGYSPPSSGDLTPWACQGVLLVNCVLTVRAGKPNSHRKKGWWSRFTKRAIELVVAKDSRVVFCLWPRRSA
jgi:uracil-DNA glycosylase